MLSLSKITSAAKGKVRDLSILSKPLGEFPAVFGEGDVGDDEPFENIAYSQILGISRLRIESKELDYADCNMPRKLLGMVLKMGTCAPWTGRLQHTFLDICGCQCDRYKAGWEHLPLGSDHRWADTAPAVFATDGSKPPDGNDDFDPLLVFLQKF